MKLKALAEIIAFLLLASIIVVGYLEYIGVIG